MPLPHVINDTHAGSAHACSALMHSGTYLHTDKAHACMPTMFGHVPCVTYHRVTQISVVIAE